MTAIVAAVIVAAVVTVVSLALITHVVAQCAARAAACCCANQRAIGPAHAAADHVTAGCAQCATNRGFATAAFVGADRAASCTTDARADGRTGTAAKLLADDRA